MKQTGVSALQHYICTGMGLEMKNYYDMSKVDFVVDDSEYEILDVTTLSGKPGSRLERGNRILALVEVQINGSKLHLDGKEAERFIEQFEEYQQNKGKGLVE